MISNTLRNVNRTNWALRLFTSLTAALLIFGAIATASASQSLKGQTEFQKLPAGIRRWYSAETDRLSRAVGTRLASPAQNSQDPFYTPEAKNIFNLIGYWIPASETARQDQALPGWLRTLTTRTVAGERQVLLFVHPESASLYTDVLKHSRGQETFRAMATASSRSLLAWKPGFENNPFIAKVSLNKSIGHVTRTILDGELAQSAIVEKALRSDRKILPKNMVVMDEVSAIRVRSIENAGQILRTFPKEFYHGNSEFVPLFALYGTSENATEPLLVPMLERSELPPDEFIRREIIRPFVSMWFHLVVKNGMVMEPHAQNVLIEIKDGLLTGRFALRDFGGFNVDWAARSKLGLWAPDPSLIPKGVNANFAGDHANMIQLSLRSYFESGFLTNLDKQIPLWFKSGLIGRPFSRRRIWNSIMNRVLREELSREAAIYSGEKHKFRSDFSDVPQLIERLRARFKASGLRCESLFST